MRSLVIMYGIIYRIVNKLNGNLYVGQTIKTLEERWYSHKKDAKRKDYPLYRSIRKYGLRNFYIEQLDIANDQEELNTKEIYYTEYLNTMAPNGYNLKAGNGRGYLSDETKKKMSKPKSKRGKDHHCFGKKYSEETKKKMSDAAMGNKNHRFGVTPSKETRDKLSKSNQGNGNPLFGEKHTTESKKKISISKTKKWVKILCHQNNVIYHSLNNAARALSVHPHSITQNLTGKTKIVAKKYTFCYVK